jgi:hypothetical protein
MISKDLDVINGEAETVLIWDLIRVVKLLLCVQSSKGKHHEIFVTLLLDRSLSASKLFLFAAKLTPHTCVCKYINMRPYYIVGGICRCSSYTVQWLMNIFYKCC